MRITKESESSETGFVGNAYETKIRGFQNRQNNGR